MQDVDYGSSQDDKGTEQNQDIALAKMIDIDPNDTEFIQKVQKHIFSPEAIKSPKFIELLDEVEQTDFTNNEDSDKLGDLDLTPTHSVQPNKDGGSLVVPVQQGLEFSPVDVGNELNILDKTIVSDEEAIEEEGNDTSSPLEEHGSHEGEGSKFGSEDSSSRSDESNLEWVKNIGVFEFRQEETDGLVGDGIETMSFQVLCQELEVSIVNHLFIDISVYLFLCPYKCEIVIVNFV